MEKVNIKNVTIVIKKKLKENRINKSIMNFQWVEENYKGITSVYDIYNHYCYLGPKPMSFPEFIELLHTKYEVISKRRQVKGIKYTKYIIV